MPFFYLIAPGAHPPSPAAVVVVGRSPSMAGPWCRVPAGDRVAHGRRRGAGFPNWGTIVPVVGNVRNCGQVEVRGCEKFYTVEGWLVTDRLQVARVIGAAVEVRPRARGSRGEGPVIGIGATVRSASCILPETPISAARASRVSRLLSGKFSGMFPKSVRVPCRSLASLARISRLRSWCPGALVAVGPGLVPTRSSRARPEPS